MAHDKDKIMFIHYDILFHIDLRDPILCNPPIDITADLWLIKWQPDRVSAIALEGRTQKQNEINK